MDRKERQKFRTTAKWKKFRLYMKKLYNNRDVVTNKPLIAGWNLHHLDQNPNNYAILKDENFVPLNKLTHKCVHWLYTYWVRDPDVLKRIEILLKEMYRLTNSK